jgi:hypothetical protein
VLEDYGAIITGCTADGVTGELSIPRELDGYVVTGIGESAFVFCEIIGVIIPEGVMSIGDWAFAGCSGLVSVTIPNSIMSIGNAAFSGCDGLISATIPNSVTSIGYGVFYGCSGLTTLTISNSVTHISDSAFQECSGLTSVIIPDSVVSIDEWAFYGCSGLTSVTIPDSVTSIGGFAFANCGGLVSLTIPSSVVSIGDKAFRYAGYDGEIDDEDVIYGSDNVILTIIEGSYAAQYARENGIPYTYTKVPGNQPDDSLRLAVSSAKTADELLIKQIDEYFTMTKEEIIGKLGQDFSVVAAGPEGICDGYFYEDLGMAFAFYPDEEILDSIDCYPNFKIHGVGIGNDFSEIMEALGDTEIVETWLELPIYTVYMVRYRLGNSDFSFIAFEEDAPVYSFWIHQMPYTGSDDDDKVFALISGNTFSFLSGVGGWSTEVVVSEDGSFTGYFHDWDMGDIGDGYPEGTLYECYFSGKFFVTEMIDPYTYELWLAALDLEGETGVEDIAGGVRVINADAYGISGGDVFMLYCPGKETADLSEEFLEWMRMPNAWEEIPDVLPFYGLYNINEGTGFFY